MHATLAVTQRRALHNALCCGLRIPRVRALSAWPLRSDAIARCTDDMANNAD
jgi:hypothetical protein